MIVAVLLSGCDGTVSDKVVNKTDNKSLVFTNKSVWQGDASNCLSSDQDDNCLINQIKATGTSEALAAAQYITDKGEVGYIAAYEQVGRIGLATIDYPYRANNNASYLLIPTSGETIDVANLAKSITSDERWIEFQQSHPQVEIWDPVTLKSKQTTAEGTNLIFSYPIKSCRACDDIAVLNLSYQFNPLGEYIETKLLNIDTSIH